MSTPTTPTTPLRPMPETPDWVINNFLHSSGSNATPTPMANITANVTAAPSAPSTPRQFAFTAATDSDGSPLSSLASTPLSTPPNSPRQFPPAGYHLVIGPGPHQPPAPTTMPRRPILKPAAPGSRSVGTERKVSIASPTAASFAQHVLQPIPSPSPSPVQAPRARRERPVAAVGERRSKRLEEGRKRKAEAEVEEEEKAAEKEKEKVVLKSHHYSLLAEENEDEEGFRDAGRRFKRVKRGQHRDENAPGVVLRFPAGWKVPDVVVVSAPAAAGSGMSIGKRGNGRKDAGKKVAAGGITKKAAVAKRKGKKSAGGRK